jgi:glycerol-3-phosphate acyltransferase PlsX
MRIALDAMGGDHAPGPIVAGAVHAVAERADLSVVLVGDEGAVRPLVPADAPRLEFFHCSQAIGMDESPVAGLRRKPDNSISRAWQLLAQKKVDGVVSAGNTGAVVAGGLFLKKFLRNVRRPGIAAVLPTFKGDCVLIDVGANVSPKPEHLFQYGIMGSIFARHILHRPRPRIGLLNVGSEEAKGHDFAKETYALFNASQFKDQFVGNVEGRDLNKGACDVVVCDGFVGNIVLKVCEGLFDFFVQTAATEICSALDSERERAHRAFDTLADRYHYSEFGGAPLLGIDGTCIICHGSSDDRAIKNALLVAARYASSRLNELIVQELESNPALTTSPD